ncbi:site-specific integrase [Stenotrophomonas sp. GZD-301]|uniref:site-specific integrase n=1 Tax=Stenotrophomonas sp. GZD-301 TaxID=3404814 RepID=UPI003BB55B62
MRKLAGGQLKFYYRYTKPNGQRDRIAIGTGWALADAREAAAALSRRYQSGDRDLRQAIADEAAAAERAKAAEAVATGRRQKATLGALMNAYVESLKDAGKVSAGGVERAVKLHLERAWPDLWAMPAAQVELDDLIPVMARLIKAGKLREAGKMRSYLRAAYASAIRAKQDAAAPDALRAVNLSRNPAHDLATIDSGAPRNHALSIADLRAYWRRIAAMTDARGAMLRFHLLLGAQRIKQMARMVDADYDRDHASVRILDIKGRRKRPRLHFVPLIDHSLAALQVMRGEADGPYLFSITGGLRPVTYDVFRGALDKVVDDMAACDELEGPRFTPGDLRRTVETRLAAAGYSEEVRGHVQSHGLSGVQKRHYNMYEYDAEKRAAIAALYDLLTGKAATITPIRLKKAV